MIKKKLRFKKYRINYFEGDDLDIVFQYLDSRKKRASSVIEICLLTRYLPMIISEHEERYCHVASNSITSISYWAKLNRDYASLPEKPDVEYRKTHPSMNKVESETIPLGKTIDCLVNYIESYLEQDFGDCVAEVLCMRYLPIALGEKSDRFKFTALESMRACEAAVESLKVCTGFSSIDPPAVMSLPLSTASVEKEIVQIDSASQKDVGPDNKDSEVEQEEEKEEEFFGVNFDDEFFD